MSHWVPSHHNNADEYMGSGLPFALHIDDVDNNTSAQQVKFPYVTRWITVYAHAQDIRVGFTLHGVNGHVTKNFIVVKAGTHTGRLELKCNEIWLRADSANNGQASIVAGYTNIPHNRFVNLTGSIEGTTHFSGVG